MKTNSRHGTAGFTLIELMAVITIIVILAGLVVGGMGFVNDRQAKEKAKVQIALLSKALEEFKLDNGTYPLTTDKPGTYTSATGTGTSSVLFKYLYWDSDSDSAGVPADTDQKIYVPELDPATSKQGWTTGTAGTATIITDPWGNQYCYRTLITGTKLTAEKDTDGTVKTNPNTQNPDFDLWSMGKDGKTNEDMNHKDSLDDIKNF